MGKVVGGTLTTPMNTYTKDQIETIVDGKIDDITPKKGVDYWNEKDKAEIKAYVDEAILGGAW